MFVPRMPATHESLLPLPGMQASFRDHFQSAARFREDSALLSALERELDPVLEALHVAFAPADEPRALHEAYALLSLLCRKAALLGATPGVVLLISDGLARALREVGIALSADHAGELAVVAVEGYCQARDERVTRELRAIAASSQVACWLGPRCMGVFLAGMHDECDLTPVLERFARDLLREDARSVLIDVSRLRSDDEEIARALGRFCGSAATLGLATFVFGATSALQAALEGWLGKSGSSVFVDDYQRAHGLAMAAAGLRINRLRRWLGLITARPQGLARP
jgi:hypothetical protein